MTKSLTLKLGSNSRTVSVDENITSIIFSFMAALNYHFPLFYGEEDMESDEWFYPGGNIYLRENGEVIDFVMDDIKVFSFPCSNAELQLKFLYERRKSCQNRRFIQEADDLVTVWLYDNDTRKTYTDITSIEDWKIFVREKLSLKNFFEAHLNYNYVDSEGNFQVVRIFLRRAEALASIGAPRDNIFTFRQDVC